MIHRESAGTPRISVIICTRDRSECIGNAVRSVLRACYPNREVLVVDQSQSDATAKVLSRFMHDGQIRYIRSTEQGLSRARNSGLAESTGDIVAFTDDDCTVSEDWLHRIADAFESDESIGIVFGSVTPAPHDHENGFIPSTERHAPIVISRSRDRYRIGGMGACTAIRRPLWKKLGGFDTSLGAGSPLRAAEDTDFSLRALHQGFKVFETPAVRVVHHGFRNWGEQDAVVFDYLFGSGAMFAKHMRLRRRGTTALLFQVFSAWLFKPPLIRYTSKPNRMLRLTSFCKGWREGMKMPIDQTSEHFADVRQ